MLRRTVTYLPGNTTSSRHIPAPFDIASIPGAEITHLVYCFAGFMLQGTSWIPTWPEPHDAEPGDKRSNISKLIALKERWPSLHILISIGGWNHSHEGDPSYKTTPAFSAVSATPSSRQAFVSSCIELFIKPGHPGLGRLFDGIDIDWEFPAPADYHNLTLLLQEFRLQLDQTGFTDERQLFLTAASGDGSESGLELSSLATTLDWVNLMAYNAHRAGTDSHNTFTDFGAPIYPSPDEPKSNVTWDVDTVVKAFLQAGLPAQRLVIGVSGYGRSYAGVADINHGLYQTYSGAGPGTAGGAAGALTYSEIVNQYLFTSDYTWFMDNNTRSVYLYSPTQHVWISYEDPTGVVGKLGLVFQSNLAGLMLWDISADIPSGVLTPGQLSLLDTMWELTAVNLYHNYQLILTEHSSLAPALCSHSGCLFLAWTESSNKRLSVMHSTDNGATFEGKVTSPEISNVGAALASHDRLNVKVPPQHNLRLAWPGTNIPNVLNVARVPLSANTSGTFGGIEPLANKYVLTDTSSTSLALASLGGRLFLAWRSLASDDLNIMFSSDDGATFEGKIVLASTIVASDAAPALATHNGNLFIAWKASQTGNLNIAQVSFSTDSSGAFQGIEGLIGQTTLAETSSAAPALCSHNGFLFLARKGPGNDTRLYVMFSKNGAEFGLETTLLANSDAAPTLASHDGTLFIAWSGAGMDNSLRVGVLSYA